MGFSFPLPCSLALVSFFGAGSRVFLFTLSVIRRKTPNTTSSTDNGAVVDNLAIATEAARRIIAELKATKV